MVTLVRLVCHFAGSWENETRMARICGMQGLKTNAWEISVESVLNHTCFPLGPRTPLVKLYVFKRKKESRMRRTHLLFRPPYIKEHFFPPEANKVATSRVVSTIFHYNIETQTAVFFFRYILLLSGFWQNQRKKSQTYQDPNLNKLAWYLSILSFS